MKKHPENGETPRKPSSRTTRRILIAVIIALIIVLIALIFAFVLRIWVDLSGIQSCTVFDADGAHEQKMLPVCGYNGVVSQDSPVMFMAKDDLVKNMRFQPTGSATISTWK